MGIASTTNTAFLGVGQYPPPTVRGAYYTVAGEMVARQSLPDDPQGVFSLTLSNLVIGSAVQIEATDGTALENRTATSATEVFNLSVYSPGSPLNSLRIKVRKGSLVPHYKPWDTFVTVVSGSQSIYVSQIPD